MLCGHARGGGRRFWQTAIPKYFHRFDARLTITSCNAGRQCCLSPTDGVLSIVFEKCSRIQTTEQIGRLREVSADNVLNGRCGHSSQRAWR